MSFYDDATGVIVATGREDGTKFMMKPAPGTLDLALTRGSDKEVTEVGSDGYIKKSQVNLLLQSNQFDTTWATTSASVTSGQTDKDGGANAWLLSSTASGDSYIQQTTSVAGLQIATIIAKSGTADFVYIRFSTGAGVWVDLTDGSVQTGGSPVLSVVSDEGGGYYRCSVAVIGSPTNVRVYATDASGSTSSASGSNIIIQNAQLNYGTTPDTYQETTTAAVVANITSNLPIEDYTGRSCPRWRQRPQVQNMLLHTEYVANWGGTVNYNNASSPEGRTNATQLVKTSASAQFVNTSWSGSSLSTTTPYIYGAWFKYDGDDVDVRLEYNNSNDWGVIWTALFEVRSSGVTTSTVSNCTSEVIAFADDWYLCLAYVTTGASITPSSPSNLMRVIGASGASVLYYGGVFREGNAGDFDGYIPCYGSSATRLADVVGTTNLSTIFTTSSQGTMCFRLTPTSTVTSGTEDRIRFGSSGTPLQLAFYFDMSGVRFYDHVAGGMLTDSITSVGDDVILTVRFQNNAADAWMDGVKQTGTTGGTYDITQLALMSAGTTDPWGIDWELLYFNPAVLDDADCAILGREV